MKTKTSLILINFITILSLNTFAQAGNNVKKDTVYYMVDTAKTPVADRMFIVGEEGDFYGYRLTCQCYPGNTDASFTYIAKIKGVELSQTAVKKINFITLRKLISIVVQYGKDKEGNDIFYFVEPYNNHFIQHKVVLIEPMGPRTSIDIENVPPDSTKKQKHN